MWETLGTGVRWLFGWLLLRKAAESTADKEAASIAQTQAAEKRTDFQKVTEGYERLQATMQLRIDDMGKELRTERESRTAIETTMKTEMAAMEAASEARERLNQARMNKIRIQLNDCVERDREGRVTINSLQGELRKANERIDELKRRMDEHDSDEHKSPFFTPKDDKYKPDETKGDD